MPGEETICIDIRPWRIMLKNFVIMLCSNALKCFDYASKNCWGERSSPHTCGENGKLSICIYICMYIYICIYIYVWYVRIPYIYTSCPICARCNISTLPVTTGTVAQETRLKERLNSGNQRNRDLTTVRKGRHYYQDRG